MVDIDQIERLIEIGDEVRRSVPANMQESEEILKQKDSIISQAYLEAQRIKGAAEQQATSLTSTAQEEYSLRVSESEVLKAAEAKGEEIKEKASQEGPSDHPGLPAKGSPLHERVRCNLRRAP